MSRTGMMPVGLSFLLLIAAATSKTFTRCELAQKLLALDFPRSQLGDWVCLAENESTLDTSARGPANSDGSRDYGIFQINDRYWCGQEAGGGCGLECKALLDDDISDDATCAKTVFAEFLKFKGDGFLAWEAWKAKCRDRDVSAYLKGCGLIGGDAGWGFSE